MSIWDKYPNYTDEEFRTLVAITAQTLLEAAGPDVPKDMLRMSPQAAARELAPLMQDEGVGKAQLQAVLEDDELSKEACLKVLDEVRKNPELAQRIAAAYDASGKKMVIPELLLLAGAVVVLAIKIRTARWGGGRGELTFYKSSDAVKTFVSGLAKTAVG